MSMIFKTVNSDLDGDKVRLSRQKHVVYLDIPQKSKDTIEKSQSHREYEMFKAIEDIKLVVGSSYDFVERAYKHKKAILLVVNFSISIEKTDLFDFLVHLKDINNLPFLFILPPSQSNRLIANYRETLFIYQEADDFITTPVVNSVLTAKVNRAVSGNYRQAKRFRADDAVNYTFPMRDDKLLKARLLDISISGFHLRTDDGIFTNGEQLQMQIPLSKYRLFDINYGELLKVAGVVERTNIAGNEAGCRINHLEEKQKSMLKLVVHNIYSNHMITNTQMALADESDSIEGNEDTQVAAAVPEPHPPASVE